MIHDDIVNGPRGAVVGPLRVWLQSPGLAKQAQALGQYARYDSVLPQVLSELAILVTARYWSSGFEWSHHAPIAIEAGLSRDAVDAISKAKRYAFGDAEMQAVFDFAVELHLLKNVSDVTYDKALTLLGQQACVDLVGICGYYTLISMTINVFDVPDGEGPNLPALDLGLSRYFSV
ncbi:carboxymuconolactone decarboxylase family protein [Planktotalea sp.]|uniref:carboxymuconolactone decarboxylase family protein n=1 Tax=Planktotalea sp. TaxID=2029877 RepID=UPI0025EA800F|nr:carboxymuconolactone decarboxylase family protein [Planktotalea sp.]